MLRKFGTALIIFFVIVAIAAIYMGVRLWRYSKKVDAITVEQVDIARVADGTYEGETDLVLVKAHVRATVQNGRLTDLSILDHQHGKGYSGAAITGRVLENQSLQVDAISGATASSKAILKATEIALRKGLGSAAPPDTAAE